MHTFNPESWPSIKLGKFWLPKILLETLFFQKTALATLGGEIRGVGVQENWGVGGIWEGEREIGDLIGQDGKETGRGIISKHFVIKKRLKGGS